MGLGQVRSGTSQPSSSSAASFAGGSYGHGYRHSLQLKVCSSRKPDIFEQSPFQSVLPSPKVLKIYFSSKQESQSFPLCFLACPTPEKGVAWPHWHTASQISMGWVVFNLLPTYPTKYFQITRVTCWPAFYYPFPLLSLLAKYLSEAFHTRKNLQFRCIRFKEVHLLCFGYGLSLLTLTSP